MDGTLALQISKDTVPDLDTANTELDNIWDFIFSSEITSVLFKFEILSLSLIKFLFFSVAWNTKR